MTHYSHEHATNEGYYKRKSFPFLDKEGDLMTPGKKQGFHTSASGGEVGSKEKSLNTRCVGEAHIVLPLPG